MKALFWFTVSLVATSAWSETARAEDDAYPQLSWAYSQSNTDNALNWHNQSDGWLGVIPKGVTITVSTCDANNGTDTYVRVWSSVKGAWVASNDDACGGRASYLTYTPEQTETVTVRVGCYSNTACNATVSVTSNTTIAQRYAPVLYASVFNSPPYSPRADHITNFEFDNDFIATNNRSNTPFFDHFAHVYFTNVETSTVWYPSYYFFHSDDNQKYGHENDLEGVQFQIKKDGSFYGQLWVMQVERHGGIYFYTNQPNIGGAISAGGIMLEPDSAGPNAANHPKVYIEPRGHGVHTCTSSICNPNSVSGGTGTGIIYRRGETAQKPGDAGTNTGSTVWSMSGAVSYKMIGLSDFGRWDNASLPGASVGLFALRWNPNVMITPASALNSNGNMKGNPAGATIPFGRTNGNGWGAYGRWVCNPAVQFFGNLSGSNNIPLNTNYIRNVYGGTGSNLGSPSASSCIDQ